MSCKIIILSFFNTIYLLTPKKFSTDINIILFYLPKIEEEEFLLQELRRIEARKKERAKKAQDLQKLISAADRSPSTPATPAVQSSTAPKKKFYKGPLASTSTAETIVKK